MQPAKEKKKSNHFNKKYMIKTVKYVRMVVQLIFFVMLPSLFDQAFTGVKNTADAIGKGNVLQWDSFTKILLILLIVTLLFGRVFCGYACAFGALGDYIYFLTGKIRACINIKVKHGKAGKIKYPVLAVILILCFLGKKDLVTKYSPWTVFSFIVSENFKETFSSSLASIIIFGIIIVAMSVEERFFCRHLCPMGAVFAIVPSGILARIHKGKNCISSCHACSKNCPLDIEPGAEEERGECITCLRCVVVCPGKNLSIVNNKAKN